MRYLFPYYIMNEKSGENMPKPVNVNLDEVEMNPDRVEIRWGSVNTWVSFQDAQR